jgi:hypothetical protein
MVCCPETNSQDTPVEDEILDADSQEKEAEKTQAEPDDEFERYRLLSQGMGPISMSDSSPSSAGGSRSSTPPQSPHTMECEAHRSHRIKRSKKKDDHLRGGKKHRQEKKAAGKTAARSGLEQIDANDDMGTEERVSDCSNTCDADASPEPAPASSSSRFFTTLRRFSKGTPTGNVGDTFNGERPGIREPSGGSEAGSKLGGLRNLFRRKENRGTDPRV